MLENIRGLPTVNIGASSVRGVRLKGPGDRPDQELTCSIMACHVPDGSLALGLHDRPFWATRPLSIQFRRVAGA
jgi:hypothetical protein